MGQIHARRAVRRVRRVAVFGAAVVFAIGSAIAATPESTPAGPPAGQKVAQGSDCLSCHAVDHKIVGPSLAAVAGRFAGKPGAQSLLMDAVKNGHVGTWGQIPMPPHPQLSPKQLQEVVAWVLSLAPNGKAPAAGAAATTAKLYHYVVNGKTVSLNFQVFQPGTHKVSADVFRGFELFNSYCFRCHGTDATGSEYAPDLRKSVLNGMSAARMTDIAMVGAKAKGMPSWAGFFEPPQIRKIYDYVAARAYKLVGQGTPQQ
ncbi:MAG TPA: c-type cytochrome [Steroidobacteraceae bacterium]|nr:c-type cytochrome [Steroidobacteraceae bacterium]